MKMVLLVFIFVLNCALAEEKQPASESACDPKTSVCEEANPEMYKKFEAYQNAMDKRYRDYQKLRGQALKTAGWKEIARCDDGHTWAYVLEKGGDYLKCEGINALGGPEEHPCVPFTDDLEAFKKNSVKAKAYVDEYDKASKAKNLEKFLTKKTKEKSIPNCW